MDVKEQYRMYRLAYYLVTEEKYNMLHIHNERNEVWLEKRYKKNTNIIRFIQLGFNWKNHLKSDIARVFQRVQTMKDLFSGQNVSIYNIYVSDFEPVDTWEPLKKTMILKERKPLQMNVFYLTEDSLPREQERLFQKMNTDPMPVHELPDEANQEKDVSFYKEAMNHMLQVKSKQVKQTMTFGKPRLTYIFILVNLLMFFVLEFRGGSNNLEVLVTNGAKYNPAIINGEWWRLVTSMFLHIGLLHLVMNMIALYYIGMITERIFGSIRFGIIYFMAGIGGSLASFAFNPNVSAGASGALFGLFGALLFFGLIHKRLFQQTMGKSIALILIINLAIGLFLPQIDMGAHLGGLIFGFLAATIVFLPNRQHLGWQITALFTYLFVSTLLILYGL